MTMQGSGLRIALGDVSGLKPTGFGFELLEEGGYSAKIVNYGNAQKKNGKGEHFSVDVILTEKGFEGVEKTLYLQYPATNLQGMSEDDINAYHTFPKRNWLAFLSSLGYADDVIAANAANLEITDDVIRNAPGGGTCCIGVTIKDEAILDKFGKETGKTRENENRNFITRTDYTKHSVTRKRETAMQAGGQGQQQQRPSTPQPTQPARSLGGSPAPGAFGGGIGGAPTGGGMPAPMGGNGMSPAPSAGGGLANSLGSRPPA